LTNPSRYLIKYGENYNVQQLGAMDWREQASAVAYEHFGVFLLGTNVWYRNGGYLARHLGHMGLNPTMDTVVC
jgi:hypothetical protein